MLRAELWASASKRKAWPEGSTAEQRCEGHAPQRGSRANSIPHQKRARTERRQARRPCARLYRRAGQPFRPRRWTRLGRSHRQQRTGHASTSRISPGRCGAVQESLRRVRGKCAGSHRERGLNVRRRTDLVSPEKALDRRTRTRAILEKHRAQQQGARSYQGRECSRLAQ